MKRPTNRLRGAAASTVVGSLLGLAAGAGLMWALGSHLLTPNRTEGARRPVTTHGEWVYIKGQGGDSIRSYVAYPERKDKAPAIIVIHEIFGLTDWEPTVADRLAGNGYVAIVPDLLSPRFGVTPADPDSGRKLTALLDGPEVNQNLDVVYRYLETLPAVKPGSIGVIGFCWGGGRSWRYAVHNPGLIAAVVCYGPAPDSADLPQIRASVLGVYGENDARINQALPAVDSQMQALHKPFTYRIYPGTGHGFLKPGRRGSDGPEVEQAWADILSFYHGRFAGR